MEIPGGVCRRKALREAGPDVQTWDLQRMTDTRIIKKYPNRRLYDTAISSYITLEDVKRLVLEGAAFNVIDARSGEEITRTILLQIISEEEEQGEPIFSTELLANIIRFYGDSLQGMMGRYLEQSLRMFVDQQHQFRDQMNSFGSLNRSLNPLSMMSDFADQNLAMWKGMQEQFYKQVAEGRITPPSMPKEKGSGGKK